jgi:hypothetical protein
MRAARLLLLLVPVLAMAGVRTYPPQAGGIAGSAGPRPDEGLYSEVVVEELRAGAPEAEVNVQRINNDGDMVGFYNVGADAHASINRAGSWIDLGVGGGYTVSAGFALSESGAFGGYSFTSSGGNSWRAIWGDSDDVAVNLETGITPTHDNFWYGIQDDLDRVGCKNRDDDTFPDPNQTVLWDGSSEVDLHTPVITAQKGSGPGVGFEFSCGRDINSGAIVGEVQAEGFAQRGWHRTAGGTITILGGAGAYPHMVEAVEVNASGQVAGKGRLTSGWSADYAMVWSAGAYASDGSKEHALAPFNSAAGAIDSHGCTTGTLFATVGERAYFSQVMQDGTRHVYNLTELESTGTITLQECYDLNDSHVFVCRGFITASPVTTRYYRVTPNL